MTAVPMLCIHPGLIVAAALLTAAFALLVVRSLSSAGPSPCPDGGTSTSDSDERRYTALIRTIDSPPIGAFNWDDHDYSSKGLMFVKTHKTSSSTLSRLIYRALCEVRGRRCFLPKRESPGKIWDLRKGSDYKYVTAGAPYQVWVSHVMVTRSLWAVMDPEPFLVSVCRHPALRFRSAWAWYGHENRFGLSLSHYIANINASLFEKSRDGSRKYRGRGVGQRTVVGSSKQIVYPYRTGLDSVHEEITGNEDGRLSISPDGIISGPFSPFKRLVEGIYGAESLLLVSDRLDESLLVLGMFMRWDLTDLLYASQKVTSPPLGPLSEAEMRTLEAAQPLDFALYRAANSMLNYYIQQYPAGQGAFEEALQRLRHCLSAAHSLCEADAKTRADAVSSVSAYGNDSSLTATKRDPSYTRIFSYHVIDNPGNGSNVTARNVTIDLTASSAADTTLYCASLHRDNDQAVRYEWLRPRHDRGGLQKINATYTWGPSTRTQLTLLPA